MDDVGKEHKKAKDIERRVELIHELRRLGTERSRLLAATREGAR
jgi:hypothetical protein